MPKIKTARDPWERWKGLVLAAKERLQMTDEEIAARLVTPGMGVRPPCRQTVTKWRKAPHGTTGECFWMGIHDYSRYGDPWGIYTSTRIGIRTDTGEVFWTDLNNVTLAESQAA